MCIVTFFPNSEGFIFTSNRDENYQRKTLEPATYNHPTPLIYPKDMEQGGTWFAVDAEQKQLICLLNATGSQPDSNLKISRGQLPIKLLLDDDTILSKSTLPKIAPFKLIKVCFLETLKLESFHWDGIHLNTKTLDATKPHLWCSNTLYDEVKKQSLNNDFKNSLNEFNQWNDLIDFHEKVSQPINNAEFIKKDHGLQTVSITSLMHQNKQLDLYYNNLLEDNQPLKKVIKHRNQIPAIALISEMILSAKTSAAS